MKTARKTKARQAGRKNGKTSTARSLQNSAGRVLRRGRKTLGRAYDWAHEAAESSHLPQLRMPRRSDIAQLSEANPLLLGAVGLGLGVAIGTLFPRGMTRSTTPARATRKMNSRPSPAAKPARRRRRKARTAAADTATSAG